MFFEILWYPSEDDVEQDVMNLVSNEMSSDLHGLKNKCVCGKKGIYCHFISSCIRWFIFNPAEFRFEGTA